ncbi:MAG: hypothetical protein PBV00_01495 [Pseudomonas asiatica]
MGIQRKTLSLFYCDGDIHACLGDQGSRTVFRGGGQALAEWNGSAESNVSLLSVSESGSVNGMAHQGEWERFDYTAYGHCSSLSSGHSLLGFNGEYYGNLINGYLLGNGYKFFNGLRFYSPDSFSPFRVLNAYGYCDGDPINYTDSSGHLRVWFRSPAYKRSKKLMRQLDSMASEFQVMTNKLKHDPRLDRTSKIKKRFISDLTPMEESAKSLMSNLAGLAGTSPENFTRASAKVDYPSMRKRLAKAINEYVFTYELMLFKIRIQRPGKLRLSHSQSYRGSPAGGETSSGALRRTRSVDEGLNLSNEGSAIRKV